MGAAANLKLLVISAAILSLAATLGPASAEAEEAGDKTLRKITQLDEVVVTSEEFQAELETPNMEVIDPDRFPMSLGGTLDTVLERQPGIQVQRIQQMGTSIDDDSIKIRASGPGASR